MPGGGGTRILVGCLEIPCRRATHHGNHHIGLHGRFDCRGNVAVQRVAHGTTLGISAVGFADHRLDSVVNGNHLAIGLRGSVVAQHIIDIIGIRSDNGNFHVLAQRQCAIILEQGDGLQRCLLCRGNSGRGMDFLLCCFGIDVGIFKQSHLEFQPQHPLHGSVDSLFAHFTTSHGLDELGIAVAAQVHVYTSQ